MNGLEVIQEFSKYFPYFRIEHRTRDYFHPELKDFSAYLYWGRLYVVTLISHFDLDSLRLNKFVKFKIFKEHGYYYNFIGYYKEDVAVETIIRYWKKYRWDYLKNLAEWKYHPSKICFDV
jgi:hypothetical protein